MQHTAHHAIGTRLQMWKTFFETGTDTTPDGAPDAEYDYERLCELAYQGDNETLKDLADVVLLMGANYVMRMNNAMADTLMQDDAMPMQSPCSGTKAARITLAELDAALAGF